MSPTTTSVNRTDRPDRHRSSMALWLLGGIVVIVLAVLLLWKVTEAVPRFQTDDPGLGGGDAARGALVFAVGDCASCHATPGQSDRLKLGGGQALASPFGTFRVPNISPDPVDGIGLWSASDLANALIAGVSPDRQHYYPVFPYPSYTGMTLADVRDLYAYLRTLQPVSGRPPPHRQAEILRSSQATNDAGGRAPVAQEAQQSS